MGYRINSKNLAVNRLMPRGPKSEKRLKYMHASMKGTVCLTPAYLVRVSLPKDERQPSLPLIYPQADIDALGHCGFRTQDTVTDIGEGRSAGTSPEFLVPRIDDAIPEPEAQTASIVCNGETLLKMLKIANEVCNDSEKPVTLRFYGNSQHPTDPTQAVLHAFQHAQKFLLPYAQRLRYLSRLLLFHGRIARAITWDEVAMAGGTCRCEAPRATGRRFR